MEIQVGLFCVGFAVVTSVMLYMILSISSNQDDSFDEAKANRRKMLKQLQDEKKVVSEKAKEKKSKKAIKKSKDNKEQSDAVNPELRDTNVETDFTKECVTNEATEILETRNDTAETKLEAITVVGKVKSKKKIITQPQPTDAVREQDNDVIIASNDIITKEKDYATKITQDKISTAKEHKKKKKESQEREKELLKVNTEQICQDPMPTKTDDTNITEITSQPPTSQNIAQTNRQQQQQIPMKSSKKKRSELSTINQLKHEKEAVSINLLVSLIDKAELSRTEIQMLIDALFNKQQDDVSEWLKGRQDPVAKLKKQIIDNEQALKNEKEVNLGLQAKLRELRAELTNDRVSARATEEHVTNLQAELKTLTNKLQVITEEKQTIASNIQQLQKELNDEQLLLKLKEDQIMKQRITEEENHKSLMSFQSQVTQLSAKLQENVRIIDEYKKMHSEITRTFEGAQFNVKELQNELKTQDRALTEAKTELENYVVSNKTLLDQNEHLTNQLQNQCQEINILREKNESLAKINAENWENGFSYNNKQGISEFEKKSEEQTHQIEQLTEELESTRNKMIELNLTLTRSKNECAKSYMLIEKANNEYRILNDNFNDKIKVLNKNIEELNATINEKNKEIKLLTNEIESYKQKNNTLRNKSWKIAEALKNAEKALQNKLDEQSFNENKFCVRCEKNMDLQKIHGTINRLMKHLYPDISVEENKDNIDEWLASLEETVMSSSMNGANKFNSSDLQEHNNQLQALVVHYKSIITDTERMLNQLQNDVEVEEARWKGKIKSLEQKIAKLQSNHLPDVYLDS